MCLPISVQDNEVQRQIEELPARIATSVDFANAVRNGDK